MYDWVQYHRLHHRTFKTADDPYYSEKDFLHAQVFAHIRSLSPRQEQLLSEVDMKDLEADKIVMFQKKYVSINRFKWYDLQWSSLLNSKMFFFFSFRFYWILYLIFFVLLPINAPLEYWDDSIQAALFVAFSLRYLIVLNVSWLITSAHFIWGLDKKHKPSDSNMIFLVTKSYWPQYHYLLPFDYQTGEFGNYGKHLMLWFVCHLLMWLSLSLSLSLYVCLRLPSSFALFRISKYVKWCGTFKNEWWYTQTYILIHAIYVTRHCLLFFWNGIEFWVERCKNNGSNYLTHGCVCVHMRTSSVALFCAIACFHFLLFVSPIIRLITAINCIA